MVAHKFNLALNLFSLFIYCRQKEVSHFKRKQHSGGGTNIQLKKREKRKNWCIFPFFDLIKRILDFYCKIQWIYVKLSVFFHPHGGAVTEFEIEKK